MQAISDKLKLHVGCGAGRMEGWLNCDLHPGPYVDLAFDLEQPWPLPDDCTEAIYGSHVLEHLADHHTFFTEAHRVLAEGGQMVLRTPYGGHRSAWWDVTHLRPWFAESFCHLQPGFHEEIGNPQYRGSTRSWQIDYTQLRLNGRLAPLLRRKWLRRFTVPWIEFMAEAVEELFVGLQPLKSPEKIDAFKATRHASAVPTMYVMYHHDLYGKPVRAGEELILLRIAEGQLANAYTVGKETTHGKH